MMIDHVSGCAITDGAGFCTCGAVAQLKPGGIHPSAFIHPKAHVDETCGINADCKVWQFASITRGTVLGPGCSVAPFALLDGPKIGAGSIVSMHVAIGPGFVIGDRCFIGPNVVFCNDAWPSADKDGWDADALRSGEVVAIQVGNDVSIGAGAVILPGVTIGDGAMIAAGAVIGRNVPANHLAKRDGSMVAIKDGPKRRMKAAGDAEVTYRDLAKALGRLA